MAYKRKFRSKDFAGKPKRLNPKAKSNKYGKKKRSFASRVKAVVLKTCESKDLNFAHAKGEMYHNVMYPIGITTQAGEHPVLGTGDSNRIGDKINVGGYMLRMLIGQKFDRPNVTFRYMICEVNCAMPFNYNQWFENHTGNILLDPVNKDVCRVLRSGEWRPNQASLAASGGREYTFTKKIWIPYKKQFTYGPDDGAQTMMTPAKHLYMVIGAYDAYGSITPGPGAVGDNIAYIQVCSTLYYKDP